VWRLEPNSEDDWQHLVAIAAREFGTPCYVARWRPVARALTELDRLSTNNVPVRSWLSLKTHPVPPLASEWLRSGRGVEVVSECEFLMARSLGASTDQLLVNGVAKHAWLARHALPRLRVHFDSPLEVEALAGIAAAARWRVGVRCHAPDERDARDGRFGGQFGMTEEEAVTALTTLRDAGVDAQGLHFHLGQRAHEPDAYGRAVDHLVNICRRANFRPRYVDMGGGLPTPTKATAALDGLGRAVAAAQTSFENSLEEIWLENGRFITDASTVLAVRVLDVKEREDSRYLICDGGRTNNALAADHGAHPMLTIPRRTGPARLTTICGPTCMTDDVLARVPMASNINVGDVIVWMNAGAYHLPWETRFSHGLCAVVWCDASDRMSLAREREQPHTWAEPWMIAAS
jgi:diaminopimelate decarboxylase